MGIFDFADKAIANFFKGLERNTTNQITKKVENAKLPSEALKQIKYMEDRSAELRKIMKEL